MGWIDYYVGVIGLWIFILALMLIFNKTRFFSFSLLFATGIFLFSGNLYVFAITGNPAIIGATPVGGFCFICGWVLLALASFLQKRDDG